MPLHGAGNSLVLTRKLGTQTRKTICVRPALSIGTVIAGAGCVFEVSLPQPSCKSTSGPFVMKPGTNLFKNAGFLSKSV